MIEPTCSQRDAESVRLNLSGYRVVQAVDGPLGIRKVEVESLDREGACLLCGVLTGRVHLRSLAAGSGRAGRGAAAGVVAQASLRARTEAANTGIKRLKRTGRWHRNVEHDKARVLLRSAARRGA